MRQLGRFVRDVSARYFWMAYLVSLMVIVIMRLVLDEGWKTPVGNAVDALTRSATHTIAFYVALNVALLASSVYVAVTKFKKLLKKYDKHGNKIKNESP